MNTESKDLTKVLIGALAGAAVGTLVGGAFTQKGIEIRNRVGEGSRNIANNVKDKVANVADAIADKYESAKESAADLVQKGKQKVGISTGKNSDDSDLTYAGNAVYSSAPETYETSKGPNILLGALLVSVAGTLVWSFATEKGNQTRKRMADGGKNIASTVKEKASTIASSIADGLSDAYETAKEGAVELLEKELQKSNLPLEPAS